MVFRPRSRRPSPIFGIPLSPEQPHRRSVGFINREGESWACFLVTDRSQTGRWTGHFSFRRREADGDGGEEIRTADIFVEESESEIDRKARALGRPLLAGLLASALHTRERRERNPSKLRQWFRDVLRSNSRELSGEWEDDELEVTARTLGELRSIYSSYRIDQVAHLISLVDPEAFQDTVERILEGESYDFSARDRLQFAMMVVERIEGMLPLPPFEVWVRDYLRNEGAYRIYTHALHRMGPSPGLDPGHDAPDHRPLSPPMSTPASPPVDDESRID
ncbi:MAG: hypothetical protein EA422_05275 [Gemmatimonadales bacterium]|nr:MAG: hypothetical protein EA422_05275 [Gemmatimonadales bacterium]